MNIDLTGGIQTATTTGVVGTAQSIATIPGDWTLDVRFTAMTAGHARIIIEDSPDGSTWTAARVIDIAGPENVDRRFFVRSYQLPSFLAGVAGAQARVRVAVLTASSISLAVQVLA